MSEKMEEQSQWHQSENDNLMIVAPNGDEGYWWKRAIPALNRLEADRVELVADCRFLLRFVPPWAKEVPEGLDPTFYGTLTAEGDREVKAQVDAIRARLGSGDRVKV